MPDNPSDATHNMVGMTDSEHRFFACRSEINGEIVGPNDRLEVEGPANSMGGATFCTRILAADGLCGPYIFLNRADTLDLIAHLSSLVSPAQVRVEIKGDASKMQGSTIADALNQTGRDDLHAGADPVQHDVRETRLLGGDIATQVGKTIDRLSAEGITNPDDIKAYVVALIRAGIIA